MYSFCHRNIFQGLLGSDVLKCVNHGLHLVYVLVHHYDFHKEVQLVGVIK